MKELDDFIQSWDDDDMKKIFLELKEYLEAQEGSTYDFIARPGVSYSFRAAHPNQSDRNLYAMADVVDDDPSERWLSVCFYEDMIKDPEEKGDFIPEGLSGADGYCFDLEDADKESVEYVKARLKEAYESAKG